MNTPTLEGQRVLVAGGAGFIGSHIADRLAPENEVVVLDNLSTGNADWVDDRATLIEDDIRDLDSIENAIRNYPLVSRRNSNQTGDV